MYSRGLDIGRRQEVRGDDQMVGGLFQRLGDAVHDRGAETDHFLVRIEQDGDDVGAACLQALRGPVREIADFAGDRCTRWRVSSEICGASRKRP